MAEQWLEIRIRIPTAAADLVGEALLELGCSGTTLAEHQLDTFDTPGDLSLDQDTLELRAYFPASADPAACCRQIAQRLAELAPFFPDLHRVQPEWRWLDAEDWAAGWQQHFPPLRVGRRLVICPSWVEFAPEAGVVTLTLDPGRAFGTGTHATTSLCLDALALLAAAPQPPQSVLDVGTGSGILAMAAAALGAERVVASEIDPEACQVAHDNVQLNRLDNVITVTGELVENLAGRFDLVFANILARENIRLAPHLVARMQAGGHLVLSGILIDQEAAVIAAFADYRLELLDRLHRDEWSCLVYRQHG